jgi:hypothetical protein
MKEGALRSMM